MGNRTRLVLGSALMLFLELALIRWAGANVVHLSFFSNFVLLGSFLGIGLGFLLARKDRPARPYYSLVALLALVGFILSNPVTIDRASSDVIFFTSLQTTGPKPWLSLSVIFIAVAVIMAGPGEIVGSCFHHLPRLEAYRLDLIGSLVGIVAFTLLSFAQAPSLVWGAITATLYVVLLGRPGRGLAIAAAVGLVALLAGETFVAPATTGESVSWSPYYKVTTYLQDEGRSLAVRVNGIPHQRVTTAALRERQQPQYVIPYRRLVGNPLDDVLIVGAGTGTDVAIALRKGAKRIDAVEIDPALLQLGRDRNPDHAYQDPRVTTHVDDGRSTLAEEELPASFRIAGNLALRRDGVERHNHLGKRIDSLVGQFEPRHSRGGHPVADHVLEALKRSSPNPRIPCESGALLRAVRIVAVAAGAQLRVRFLDVRGYHGHHGND